MEISEADLRRETGRARLGEARGELHLGMQVQAAQRHQQPAQPKALRLPRPLRRNRGIPKARDEALATYEGEWAILREIVVQGHAPSRRRESNLWEDHPQSRRSTARGSMTKPCSCYWTELFRGMDVKNVVPSATRDWIQAEALARRKEAQNGAAPVGRRRPEAERAVAGSHCTEEKSGAQTPSLTRI